MKFLIIEDHSMFSDLLKFWVLQNFNENCEFVVAKRINEFKECFIENTFNYFILDLFLAEGDLGLDILKLIPDKERKNIMIVSSIRQLRNSTLNKIKDIRVIVNKSSSNFELEKGLNTLVNKGIYRCKITEELILDSEKNLGTDNNISSTLTKREVEVLKLISKGKSTKEITDILFISINTVESHRKKLMEKFNVHSMSRLIQLGNEYGIL